MTIRRWEIVAYYSKLCPPPKRPGGLAIHTWHTSESSRDMEIEVFKGRKDIGYITVIDIRQRTRETIYINDVAPVAASGSRD